MDIKKNKRNKIKKDSIHFKTYSNFPRKNQNIINIFINSPYINKEYSINIKSNSNQSKNHTKSNIKNIDYQIKSYFDKKPDYIKSSFKNTPLKHYKTKQNLTEGKIFNKQKINNMKIKLIKPISLNSKNSNNSPNTLGIKYFFLKDIKKTKKYLRNIDYELKNLLSSRKKILKLKNLFYPKIIEI